MDNYPPGAAHDPNAPYNEEPCPDIDVTVRHRSYAHRYLPCLLDNCEGWEQESLKFEL